MIVSSLKPWREEATKWEGVGKRGRYGENVGQSCGEHDQISWIELLETNKNIVRVDNGYEDGSNRKILAKEV